MSSPEKTSIHCRNCNKDFQLEPVQGVVCPECDQTLRLPEVRFVEGNHLLSCALCNSATLLGEACEEVQCDYDKGKAHLCTPEYPVYCLAFLLYGSRYLIAAQERFASGQNLSDFIAKLKNALTPVMCESPENHALFNQLIAELVKLERAQSEAIGNMERAGNKLVDLIARRVASDNKNIPGAEHVLSRSPY